MHNPDRIPLDQNSFFQHRKGQHCYWLGRHTLGWALPQNRDQLGGCEFWLHAGNLRIEDGFIKSDYSYRLSQLGSVGESPELSARFPNLGWLTRFEDPGLDEHAIKLLNQQAVFTVKRDDKRVIYATGIQLFGVLDDVAFYDGDDLGVSFDQGGNPVLKLWAPTATSLKLHLYKSGTDETPIRTIEMERGERGIWIRHGEPSWKGLFYNYDIEVFVPWLVSVERFTITDPYSRSMGMNSHKAQITDTNDPALKPSDWEKILKPGLDIPEDIVLYELHVRDFSASDETVREAYRGKYMAFTEAESNGMRHLRALSEAGLTHIHLLPCFDFATVNDDPKQRREPVVPPNLPPDSAEQQRIVSELVRDDAFNWGYDPWHYLVPEGSYSTDAEGPTRVLEFREMVKGLHEAGLRVVMDVVFNHFYRVRDDDIPPFDRIVPGYYYRTDGTGKLVSTACGGSGDLATERKMMEKLMIDSLVSWAKNYKIDGFRFDLMGFHTKTNLRNVRAALDSLTLEKDGVDGKRMYIYGEGWRFGSLCDMQPGEACVQLNMYGMGVGTFNDRIRDRTRGGDHGSETKADQGFVTGLYYDDNASPNAVKVPRDPEQQRQMLFRYTDIIRASMAGNVRDYEFQDSSGRTVKGSMLDHNGSPAAYAARPSETINYVSSHDNYELWDWIAAKAPYYRPGRKPDTATVDERVRMQKLALAIVALSQGIPFFSAGSDFLRSKSGDKNSYNSGDWYNRIDFSLVDNNWGMGLPPARENQNDWDFWAPRLRNPYFKPRAADMRETAEYFRALLRVRKSSRLFRLYNLSDIQARVKFLETDYGPLQSPGLIAMALRDDLENKPEQAPWPQIDGARSFILVLFNATLSPITFKHALLKDRILHPHPDWSDAVEPRIIYGKYNSTDGAVIAPPQTVLILAEPRFKRKRTAPFGGKMR